MQHVVRILVSCGLVFAAAHSTIRATEDAVRQLSSVTQISPGPDAQYQLQSALINAVPGDVIQLAEGKFVFDTELNVVSDNVTIRGAGPQKTILSFRKQNAGSNGLVATGNAFVIEDLAVEDTVGNAVKVLGAKDVTFRRVRVEWTDGPKTTNGAYGIYPVECRNVLIEDCLAIGASDAGIYVGQSQDVIVKGCIARQNVAGIEIENTLRADVFDNEATDNTGGILIFDLPGLTLTNGGDIRIFRNNVHGNNRQNFAPLGTIVADVPTGTGVMLMATDRVEIFDNQILGSQSSNVMVVSFLVTERKIKDPKYDPYPEAFSIHHNQIEGGGTKPAGQIGVLLAPVVGTPFPEIFFDGLVDEKKLVDGKLPAELQSRIRDNGEATFANVHIGDLTPANLLTGRYKVDRDTTPWDGKPAAISPVSLRPHAEPSVNGNPAVAVYRAAPPRLSAWKLFDETDGEFRPTADLIAYDLNTPLFSDYTAKHRLIRLPTEGRIQWNPEQSLEFPVGTVIAKTFAYPDATADKTKGERYLETRIELREESGWYGYSYLWNDEQSDADLRLGGGAVDVSWTDEHGQAHKNHYQIPNANQCLSCHDRDGKFVPLGPTARNLNRPGVAPHAATAAADNLPNQLAEWVRHGILVNAPPHDQIPKLVRFDDHSTGSLDERARAWLEVNCAHCHSPHSSARTSGLDLRVSQTDPVKFGVFKSPVATGNGSGGRRYDIIPGKPDESILVFRLESTDAGARMPNLARNLVHSESTALIREWIQSMPEAKEGSR